MSQKHPQAHSANPANDEKIALQAKVEVISDAIKATGIQLDLKLLRALYRHWLKLLGKTEPERIECTVTSGPNDTNFHREFRTTYDAYGNPEFRLGFEIRYNGTSQYCYTHINRHNYRSGKQRNSFNIGGLIQFVMPDARVARIYHFTGHYSTKSSKGRFRIYTTPLDLKDLKKPSDFDSEPPVKQHQKGAQKE